MRNMDNVPAYLYISPRWTAVNRLKCLRELAGRKQLVADWRKARTLTLRDSLALSPGFNSKDYGLRSERYPVMVAFKEMQFRGEEWADECGEVGRTVTHSGWYSDADCSRTLRAFVYRLPHGRWGCGYADSDSGQRVYLLEVHKDASDAAASADHEARYYAEQEKEYNERWHEARELREEIESERIELHRAFMLRNVAGKEFDGTPIKAHFRNEVSERIENIRTMREKLADDYADIDE
jgi:hypothetical protein